MQSINRRSDPSQEKPMLPDSTGKPVPEVTFRTRQDGQWKDIASASLFKGRTVVLFALPGAYTPTCSSTHLPRYNELAPTFRKAGVDEIVCLSVNDPFVCLLYTSPSPRDRQKYRMPSS